LLSLSSNVPTGTTDELNKVIYGIEVVNYGAREDDTAIVNKLANGYTPPYRVTKAKNNDPYHLNFPVTTDDGEILKLSPKSSYLVTARVIGNNFSSNWTKKIVTIEDYEVLAPVVRVVDNANFFVLDDIDTIDNVELYTRILNEFPKWLEEVKRLGGLQGRFSAVLQGERIME